VAICSLLTSNRLTLDPLLVTESARRFRPPLRPQLPLHQPVFSASKSCSSGGNINTSKLKLISLFINLCFDYDQMCDRKHQQMNMVGKCRPSNQRRVGRYFPPPPPIFSLLPRLSQPPHASKISGWFFYSLICSIT
jgi:hypothetical protein